MILTYARVDINGSFLQAKQPVFLPPEHLLPRARQEPRIVFVDTGDGIEHIVDTICSRLREVQAEISRQLTQRNVWLDVVFPGYHISPVLGDLLKLQELQIGNETFEWVLESFRLAAILYVSNLRACFGIDVEEGAMLHLRKLRTALSKLPDGAGQTPGLPHSLLVWILAVASTSRCLPAEATDHFRALLISALEKLEIESADDLMALLAQFAWAGGIFARETEELRSHQIQRSLRI